MERLRALPFTIVAMVALCGCSHDSMSSSPTESVPQVAGTWRGAATITGISDGECVGPLLQPTVGSSAPITLTLQQSGTTLSATLLTERTQLTCSYAGTLSGSSISLTLTSCQANAILGLRCSAGERDIVLVTSAITATVAGNAMSGTQADGWNVLVARTPTNVGTLKSNESITLTK